MTLIFASLFFAQTTFASTLYSNDFTGSLSDFIQSNAAPATDSCSTSPNGLNCSIGADIIYTFGYANLKCVQADITGTGNNAIGIGDDINLASGVDIAFGSTANQNNLFLSGPGIAYDSGTPIPTSGTHNYRICHDVITSTFTGFLDNTQIFSQQISGLTALYQHGWVQTFPGNNIKNFIESGDDNLLTTYSNDFTGSLSGFSQSTLAPAADVCSTSPSGLSCSTPADIVYDTGYTNLKCIQADITDAVNNQIGMGNYINLGKNVGIALGSTANPNDIFLQSYGDNFPTYDTGIAFPTSGTHTYKLCDDASTSIFTGFLDGTQIFSKYVPVVSAFQYGSVQGRPGSYITNLVLTGSPAPTPVLLQAINAGGDTQGSFSADSNFSGGTQYSSSNSVNMIGVSNPAPEAVYQTVRYGNFAYTLPGLTANANYTLRLHFNELYWTSAGSRVFNVSVNGQSALTNYDIFAAAGGANKAIAEQIPTTADTNGNIAVQFTTVTDNAMVNGIELYSGTLPSPTPTPTPTPASSISINTGGSTIGNFLSDTDFSGGTQYSSSAIVDTTGVASPAAQTVYQSVRYGNFTYTIPNLFPNSTYNVKLHFNELYWGTDLAGGNGGIGSRVFNTSINGTEVLSNYDIFQDAGGANKAVERQFTTTSDATIYHYV